MDIEEFIVENFQNAGIRLSPSAPSDTSTPFITYTLLSWDPSYGLPSSDGSPLEKAEFSFNSFAKSKDESRLGITEACDLVNRLRKNHVGVIRKASTFTIRPLPKINGLFGMTVMAEIQYYNNL